MVQPVTSRALFVTLVAAIALNTMTSVARADEPLDILFIGNSFTNGSLVPGVRDLVISAGLPTPNCVNAAVNSQTLEWHRTNAATLAYVDQGGWDYVVLQEYSTRPTDSTTATNANPARFEQDATWFYDRVKLTSPNAKIVLFETWARHENNTMYPSQYANRDEMQQQLNYWYHHAAFSYIPANATSAVKTDVVLAPAGEVWHADYHGLNYNLHGGDLYHQNATGEHVNALTIFGAICRRQVTSLPGGGAAMEDYLRGLVDQTNALYFGGGGEYNYRPGVTAGTDLSIALPNHQATLQGQVNDDGLPDPPAAVSVTWSQHAGPDTVTFANANALNTTATFPVAGLYVLRLTADDGELTAFDDVTVTVNPQGAIPIVNYSFEDPVQTDGGFTNKQATGWTDEAGGTNAWGAKNPGASEMTGAAGVNNLAFPGDGPQYLYMNSGRISQVLPATLQASTTYTLTVAVARRLESVREDATYFLRLYAGTTLLGEFNGNTNLLTAGTLADKTVTYHVDATHAALGQPLKIVLGTSDPHVSRRLGLDNVRLYAVADYVPPTVLLGDFTGDGAVTHGDYTVWADHFGQSIAAVQAEHPGWFPAGSYLEGSATVTHGLYTTWADHFGDTLEPPLTVGQQSVPAVVDASAAGDEPASPAALRQQRQADRKAARQARALAHWAARENARQRASR